MIILLHPEAESEMAAAAKYYETQRPTLGFDFLTEASRAFDTVAASSEAWPSWPGVPQHLGLRRFVLPRFPFAIAFRTTESYIDVYALAHFRRRPNYWLARVSR